MLAQVVGIRVEETGMKKLEGLIPSEQCRGKRPEEIGECIEEQKKKVSI